MYLRVVAVPGTDSTSRGVIVASGTGLAQCEDANRRYYGWVRQSIDQKSVLR